MPKVIFKLKDKIICEYDPFLNLKEVKETKKFLAYEKGVPISEIIAEIANKKGGE